MTDHPDDRARLIAWLREQAQAYRALPGWPDRGDDMRVMGRHGAEMRDAIADLLTRDALLRQQLADCERDLSAEIARRAEMEARIAELTSGAVTLPRSGHVVLRSALVDRLDQRTMEAKELEARIAQLERIVAQYSDNYDACHCARRKTEAQRDAEGDRADRAEAQLAALRLDYERADECARRCQAAGEAAEAAFAACAEAVGVVYATDGRAVEPGPIEDVVRAIKAAEARAERAEADAKRWKEEAEGYQSCVRAAQDDPQSRTIVSVILGEGCMRIYGPTPDREIAMGEAVAQYIELLQVMAKHQREKERAERPITLPPLGADEPQPNQRTTSP